MDFREDLEKKLLNTVEKFEIKVFTLLNDSYKNSSAEKDEWFFENIFDSDWFNCVVNKNSTIVSQRESILIYTAMVWDTIAMLDNLLSNEQAIMVTKIDTGKAKGLYDALVKIYTDYIKDLLKLLADINNNKSFVDYHNYVNSLDEKKGRYTISYGCNVSLEKKEDESSVLKVNLVDQETWNISKDDELICVLKPILGKDDFKMYNKNVMWDFLLTLLYFAGDDTIDGFLERKADIIREKIKECDDYFRKMDKLRMEERNEENIGNNTGLNLCERLNIVFDFLKCFKDDITIGEARRNLFGE